MHVLLDVVLIVVGVTRGRDRARRRGPHVRGPAGRGRAVHGHDVPRVAPRASVCSPRPGAATRRATGCMALYAPLALLAFPSSRCSSCSARSRASSRGSRTTAGAARCITSGSSLFTLGFDRPPELPAAFAAFVEAAIGLALLALLIAYLPTIYNSFSRREVAVTELAVRAGTPPTPADDARARAPDRLPHRARPLLGAVDARGSPSCRRRTRRSASLAFFRSPNPHRSWITAAGAVLDAGGAAPGRASTSR